MRKNIPLILGSLLILASCASYSSTPAPEAKPAPAPMMSPAPMMMAPATDSMAAVDGKALYAAKCAGCHGADGSKGLKGKTAEYVTTALTGYRAKTFGGAKKEIMQARAALLSDADIKALAAFVSSL